MNAFGYWTILSINYRTKYVKNRKRTQEERRGIPSVKNLFMCGYLCNQNSIMLNKTNLHIENDPLTGKKNELKVIFF